MDPIEKHSDETYPEPRIDPRLAGVELASGKHKNAAEGMCVMEAVSFLAKEEFTDSPACACPMISEFARAFNDRLPDEARQSLLVLVPLLIGTHSDSPKVLIARAFVFLDHRIRQAIPLVIEWMGNVELATRLRSLSKIADSTTAESARPAVESAVKFLREYDWNALARDLALDRDLALARARALALARDLARDLDRDLALADPSNIRKIVDIGMSAIREAAAIKDEEAGQKSASTEQPAKAD